MDYVELIQHTKYSVMIWRRQKFSKPRFISFGFSHPEILNPT